MPTTTRPWAPALCLLLAACAQRLPAPSPPAPATATVQPPPTSAPGASAAPLPRENTTAKPAARANAGAAHPPDTSDAEDEKARLEKKASEARAFEELLGTTEQPWCAAPPKERCDALRAFRRAGVPKIAARDSFTLGDEVSTSDADDFAVLRFTPSNQPGTGVQAAIMTLRADNPTEVAEAHRYLASIARGRRDQNSPLHALLQTHGRRRSSPGCTLSWEAGCSNVTQQPAHSGHPSCDRRVARSTCSSGSSRVTPGDVRLAVLPVP